MEPFSLIINVIPVELINHILQYVSDTQDIKQCRLVNNLFNAIIISQYPIFNDCSKMIGASFKYVNAINYLIKRKKKEIIHKRYQLIKHLKTKYICKFSKQDKCACIEFDRNHIWVWRIFFYYNRVSVDLSNFTVRSLTYDELLTDKYLGDSYFGELIFDITSIWKTNQLL